MKEVFLAVLVVGSAVSISGCFIDPGEGGTIKYDGNFTDENGSFVMNGEVELLGPNPPQGKYENITIYLYSEEHELIDSQYLGTIYNDSTPLPVSISSEVPPEYVIIYSDDLWDGSTQIGYYVRDSYAANGYRYEQITDPDELPIIPDDIDQ